DPRAQISFVIERVEGALAAACADNDADDPGLLLKGTPLRSFEDLVELLDGETLDDIFPTSIASGTIDAFRRRLHAAAHRMAHLVRGDEAALRHTLDWDAQQVTVVDIHKLHSAAQMFVVGVLLKRMLDRKELQGTARPLVFVVLDELNKYA